MADKWRTRRRPQDPQTASSRPPAVFVVSTGRAGSKMLAHSLRLHPQVCAFHEPLPTLLTEGFARWSGDPRHEKIVSRVYNKRNNLIAQVASNGYRYLESSNYCSLLVPQLDQLFDAKFIHLHRDGRSFIKSGLRKGWYGELDQHGQYPPMRARSLLRRRLLIDIGNPGYDHRLVPPKRLSSRVEKLAWLWAEYNGAILRDLAPLPPERKLTIRLDEFGMSTFGKLHAFMDLDVESSTLEQMVQMAESKPNRGTPFSVKWSAHDERAFLSLGGQMAETLGY